MYGLLNDRRVLLPLLLTAVAIALGSVLIIVLSSDAASSSAAATESSPPAAAAGTVSLDIADFKYEPESFTVKAGGKVSWTNRDAAPHTATADGEFDTGTLKMGDEKTLTLKQPGEYTYICTIHPFMKATVIVE